MRPAPPASCLLSSPAAAWPATRCRRVRPHSMTFSSRWSAVKAERWSDNMTLSFRRLTAMARKETLHLRRDPRSLGMAFVMPALMIVFFGYVINFDVNDIKLGILDQDRSQRSEDLIEAFLSAGRFRITERLSRYGQMEALLDRGTVRMVLVIPPGFQRDLASGRPAPLQAVVDGADANTASVSLNYTEAIVNAFSSRV